MSPELQAIVEWSKLGVNVLYLGAIVYLFKDLRASQKEYVLSLLSLIERYHMQIQKNVEAFNALLHEIHDDHNS